MTGISLPILINVPVLQNNRKKKNYRIFPKYRDKLSDVPDHLKKELADYYLFIDS